MNQDIILDGFPLPPSENQLYKNVFIRGVVRRAKSEALRDYKSAVLLWSRVRPKEMMHINCVLDEWRSNGLFIGVHAYLCMPHEKFYTKAGVVKKLDASNRIKALHDALSDIIGIDDKYFWGCGIEKVETCQREYIQLRLSPVSPLEEMDLRAEHLTARAFVS